MIGSDLKIELAAVIVAIIGGEPKILLDPDLALPSGPFESSHRTLEQGLRSWAKSKASQQLGYVEQLYTFADKDRTNDGLRTISIGYLALMRKAEPAGDTAWSPWYRHLPWEDHRDTPSPLINKVILPALMRWKQDAADSVLRKRRGQRIEIAFPKDMRAWNEELVLQRYEMLWEAGLVAESPHGQQNKTTLAALGTAMPHYHRRILASAVARLRAKIKYRPVVFELMPDSFTLLHLQEAVEALAGLRLHKQNFRRLVETQRLVEETGATTSATGGRPAKLFTFRPEVLHERAAAGTKLPRTA